MFRNTHVYLLNQAQYEFVHTALLIAFSIGDTAVPVEQFLATYQLWQEKKKDSEKSAMEIQFEVRLVCICFISRGLENGDLDMWPDTGLSVKAHHFAYMLC